MDLLELVLKPSAKFIAWDLIILISIFDLGYNMVVSMTFDLPNRKSIPRVPSLNFAMRLFPGTIGEEFFFRFIPLFTCVLVTNANLIAIGITMLVSSAIFGLLHGHWKFLFLQGIGGLIYCLLYLKTGGLEDDLLNQARALLNTSVAHMSFNYTLLTIVFALSKFSNQP